MDPEPKAIPEEMCVLVQEGDKPQSQFDRIASSIYWPSFHLVLGTTATWLSLSSRIPLSPQSTLPMDSDELTGDNFQHTVAPEYNYGCANGNSDYAVPAQLGPEAISGAMLATGMD